MRRLYTDEWEGYTDEANELVQIHKEQGLAATLRRARELDVSLRDLTGLLIAEIQSACSEVILRRNMQMSKDRRSIKEGT